MVRKLGAMRAVDAALMSRLAWPEKMLYNEQREWIGYIMPAFSNTHPFADYSYDTFPALIPNVSKADQIRMSVALTELVDFLHYNNIVLCDINTSNILFDNDQNAYLIDLDSAQVAFEEKVFPTNVGLPDYLSPEHIRSCTFDFIKKKCDDVWILQNLIFKILTPCGHLTALLFTVRMTASMSKKASTHFSSTSTLPKKKFAEVHGITSFPTCLIT